MLAQTGAAYWQILPINPLGYGNSPYQPYSSFAGDPLFISPEQLHKAGFLQVLPPPFQPDAERVDYDAARQHKEAILRTAFEQFEPTAAYEAFIQEPWVYPYAVFMAFKRANGLRAWYDWPAPQKDWPYAEKFDLEPYSGDIQFEMFCQFLFRTQWLQLKAHANEMGLQIIGDIPIYVGIDSLDVWTGREHFLLDEEGKPTSVAGVPPDYFSVTGQRWGNPLYDWARMEEDGFSFWINRLRASIVLFDVIRIDHFRGFDTYWQIPASCPTAVEGEWIEAPGYALFDRIMEEIPGIQIIAEDLGMLRDEVYVLRDHYHLRGMKILQFEFEPGKPVDPKASKVHMVIYTGTHDNQTTRGWYEDMPADKQKLARRDLRRAGYWFGSFTYKFVRLALDDAADMAIIPAQDVLGLDDRARINLPGSVGSPNWEWKLASLDGLERSMKFFASAIRKSGRARG